jgi:hypothetical protein
MCEKDGHQGILSRVTSPLQVALFTSKGTWSRPSLIKVAKLVHAYVNQGKIVKIGYVGDHDPAGLYRIERTAMEGNTTGDNNSIGLRQHLEELGVTYGWSWERVALTTEQFRILQSTEPERLGSIDYDDGDDEVKLKRADSCNVEYRENFGHQRADVEILGLEGMRDCVKTFIENNTDQNKWDVSVRKSTHEVEYWKGVIDATLDAEPLEDDKMSQSIDELSTCVHCGESISNSSVCWVHFYADVDDNLGTDEWFAAKALCADGMHIAEPLEVANAEGE